MAKFIQPASPIFRIKRILILGRVITAYNNVKRYTKFWFIACYQNERKAVTLFSFR